MTSLVLVLSHAKIVRSKSSLVHSPGQIVNCTRWSPGIPTTPRSRVDNDIRASKPHPSHTRVIHVIGHTHAKNPLEW